MLGHLLEDARQGGQEAKGVRGGPQDSISPSDVAAAPSLSHLPASASSGARATSAWGPSDQLLEVLVASLTFADVRGGGGPRVAKRVDMDAGAVAGAMWGLSVLEDSRALLLSAYDSLHGHLTRSPLAAGDAGRLLQAFARVQLLPDHDVLGITLRALEAGIQSLPLPEAARALAALRALGGQAQAEARLAAALGARAITAAAALEPAEAAVVLRGLAPALPRAQRQALAGTITRSLRSRSLTLSGRDAAALLHALAEVELAAEHAALFTALSRGRLPGLIRTGARKTHLPSVQLPASKRFGTAGGVGPGSLGLMLDSCRLLGHALESTTASAVSRLLSQRAAQHTVDDLLAYLALWGLSGEAVDSTALAAVCASLAEKRGALEAADAGAAAAALAGLCTIPFQQQPAPLPAEAEALVRSLAVSVAQGIESVSHGNRTALFLCQLAWERVLGRPGPLPAACVEGPLRLAYERHAADSLARPLTPAQEQVAAALRALESGYSLQVAQGPPGDGRARVQGMGV